MWGVDWERGLPPHTGKLRGERIPSHVVRGVPWTARVLEKPYPERPVKLGAAQRALDFLIAGKVKIGDRGNETIDKVKGKNI